MYLCITINRNKFVLASSVKAFTDEPNKFTDDANIFFLIDGTTCVNITTVFSLLPSTGDGPYTGNNLLLFFFFSW